MELKSRLIIILEIGVSTLTKFEYRLASPLSEIWATNLVRAPLRSRSMTLFLLPTLLLHGFLARSVTAPLPLTQFSGRSAPRFPVRSRRPMPLRSHALAIWRPVCSLLCFPLTVLTSRLLLLYYACQSKDQTWDVEPGRTSRVIPVTITISLLLIFRFNV